MKKYIDSNKNTKNHTIVGDFNIDIMQDDNATSEFLNNFTEKEYIPCFLGITRLANDGYGGTCIDNFFFSNQILLLQKHINFAQTKLVMSIL